MTINRIYPFLLWITSLTIAPLLVAVVESLSYTTGLTVDAFKIVPLIWVYSLVLSLPALFILYVVFFLIVKKLSSAAAVKWILNALVIICIFLTFGTISSWIDALSWEITYAISVIMASVFLRVRKS